MLCKFPEVKNFMITFQIDLNVRGSRAAGVCRPWWRFWQKMRGTRGLGGHALKRLA